MKNLKLYKIIQLILIFIFLFSAKAFAAQTLQVNKNINMSLNFSRLLMFDEKIIRYKFENEKNFKSEILSNLFNTRQELLIKPINNSDSKLTVWTETKTYNINIKFQNNNEIVQKAQIDETPGIADFELDIPPKLLKNN